MLLDHDDITIKEDIAEEKKSDITTADAIIYVLNSILEKLYDTSPEKSYDPTARYQDDFFYNIKTEIRNQIAMELVEFLERSGGCEKTLNDSSLDISKYSQLFDHHFWNDCDPFWSKLHTGKYGATPGEDVIIKVSLYCKKLKNL